MVADFMRYFTRIKIFHGCRFYEILYQNQSISWLQILGDITPESKYLMVAEFMRYYTTIKITHNHNILWCEFHEILHHNENIL